jgi:uncharacterized protein (TIGR03083 family)
VSFPPEITRSALRDDLSEVWAAISDLAAELSETEWNRPTRCPGWTVRDVVSHMIGTELMLAGTGDPSVEVGDMAHVRNDIGRFNEVSVERRRSRSGPEVRAEFDTVTASRLEALDKMTEEDFAAEAWTPAGPADYGRFMQIRAFDCWMHELDIRAAVGSPGGLKGRRVERGLAEIRTALGYAVGKLAGAPDGSSVAFLVAGEPDHRFDVVVDGRAAVVDQPVDEPTVTVSCGVGDFAAVCGGRVDPLALLAGGAVEIAGDRELGERVLTNMAFVV